MIRRKHKHLMFDFVESKSSWQLVQNVEQLRYSVVVPNGKYIRFHPDLFQYSVAHEVRACMVVYSFEAIPDPE